MPSIAIGARDKLVTIEKLPTPDEAASSGFPIGTWSELGKEWMSKRDVSGNERLAAAQLSASVDSEFELPYRSDMDPDAIDLPKFRRLRFSGRVYDILRAVMAPREEGENIRLITTTSTAQGQV